MAIGEAQVGNRVENGRIELTNWYPKEVGRMYGDTHGDFRSGIIRLIKTITHEDPVDGVVAVKALLTAPLTLNESGNSNDPSTDNVYVIRDDLYSLFLELSSDQLADVGQVLFGSDIAPQSTYPPTKISDEITFGHLIGFKDDLAMKRNLFLQACLEKAKSGDVGAWGRWSEQVRSVWGNMARVDENFRVVYETPTIRAVLETDDTEALIEAAKKYGRSVYGLLDLIPRFDLTDQEKITLFDRAVRISGRERGDWFIDHPEIEMVKSLGDEAMKVRYLDRWLGEAKSLVDDAWGLETRRASERELVGMESVVWETAVVPEIEAELRTQVEYAKKRTKFVCEQLPEVIAGLKYGEAKTKLIKQFQDFVEENLDFVQIVAGVRTRGYSYLDGLELAHYILVNGLDNHSDCLPYLADLVERSMENNITPVNVERAGRLKQILKILEGENSYKLRSSDSEMEDEMRQSREDYYQRALVGVLTACNKRKVFLPMQAVEHLLETKSSEVRNAVAPFIMRESDNASDSQRMVMIMNGLADEITEEKTWNGGQSSFGEANGFFEAASRLPEDMKELIYNQLSMIFEAAGVSTEFSEFIASFRNDGLKIKALDKMLSTYVDDQYRKTHNRCTLEPRMVATVLQSIEDDEEFLRATGMVMDKLMIPVNSGLSAFFDKHARHGLRGAIWGLKTQGFHAFEMLPHEKLGYHFVDALVDGALAGAMGRVFERPDQVERFIDTISNGWAKFAGDDQRAWKPKGYGVLESSFPLGIASARSLVSLGYVEAMKKYLGH